MPMPLWVVLNIEARTEPFPSERYAKGSRADYAIGLGTGSALGEYTS